MKIQLNRGLKKRVMYIENKGSSIDGAHGRIGWVTFSKSGQTVYYRDKVLEDKRWWYLGKFLEEETGEEYWVSGVKKRGTNVHWAESIKVAVDEDAADEYKKIIAK